MSTPQRLVGGVGDKRSPSEFPKKKLDEGMRVEREHTSDKAEQREITVDHLTEDPEYYAKLKKVEKKASYAYRLGCEEALAKYAGASSPPANDGASKYRDSGSPWRTVTNDPDIRRTNIDQNFSYNRSLGPTSGESDPGYFNNVIRGGTPTIHIRSDEMGGVK